jgi:hypothetical protein
MRKPFALFAMAFMVSYSILTLLVGEKMLKKLHLKSPRQGRERQIISPLSVSSSSNYNNNNKVIASSDHVSNHSKVTSEPSIQELTEIFLESVDLPGRFPHFGTKAFRNTCPWIHDKSLPWKRRYNCTILARPPPNSGEGLSSWVAQVVSGFIMARQAGCSFRMDYGPGVAVHTVLETSRPNQILTNNEGEGRDDEGTDIRQENWVVHDPDSFTCLAKDGCFLAQFQYNDQNMWTILEIQNAINASYPLAYIPCLRHAYSTSEPYFKSMGGFRDLQRTIPGFQLESSMACSLETLFHLSRKASQYEPNLFTKMLPTLKANQGSLVLGLYIRTGHTEQLNRPEAGHKYQKLADRICTCAITLESDQTSRRYQHVVWTVISDSPWVKSYVQATYTTTNITGGGSFGIPRTIVTTQTRGAHTKPQANPTTIDWAEAFLDWYLLGESDYVLGDYSGPTFGDTAAFRTLRPYIKVSQAGFCSFISPILRW